MSFRVTNIKQLCSTDANGPSSGLEIRHLIYLKKNLKFKEKAKVEDDNC